MIDCVYCNRPFKNEKFMEKHLLICGIENKKGVYTQFKDPEHFIEKEDENGIIDLDGNENKVDIKKVILSEREKMTDPIIWERMMKKMRQSRNEKKDEIEKKNIEIESRKIYNCKYCDKKFTRAYTLNRHILSSCLSKQNSDKKEIEMNKIDKDHLIEIRRLKQQVKMLKEDDIIKTKIIENLLFYTDKIDSNIEPIIENNNIILSKICSSLFFSNQTDKKKEELFKTKWNNYIQNQIKNERHNLDELSQNDLFKKYDKSFQQLILAINRLKNLNKNFIP